MSTPHNSAAPGAFAKTVLMPGDPLRSQFIAETFLENPVLVNNVRGVQGYTGAYKGVPVSVMASGMGMPSIGIYSHELYTQYGVENIIRVGSAGALRADLELGSVVAGQGACTNSSFADQYELGVHYAPIADFDLLMAAVESARELGVKMPVGNLYSSDTFYDAAGRNGADGRLFVGRKRADIRQLPVVDGLQRLRRALCQQIGKRSAAERAGEGRFILRAVGRQKGVRPCVGERWRVPGFFFARRRDALAGVLRVQTRGDRDGLRPADRPARREGRPAGPGHDPLLCGEADTGGIPAAARHIGKDSRPGRGRK